MKSRRGSSGQKQGNSIKVPQAAERAHQQRGVSSREGNPTVKRKVCGEALGGGAKSAGE